MNIRTFNFGGNIAQNAYPTIFISMVLLIVFCTYILKTSSRACIQHTAFPNSKGEKNKTTMSIRAKYFTKKEKNRQSPNKQTDGQIEEFDKWAAK